MSAKFISSSFTSGLSRPVTIDFEVETNEDNGTGASLAVSARDWDTGREVFSYVVTDIAQIKEFFAEVEQARLEFEALLD
jgi:hypothetical protein